LILFGIIYFFYNQVKILDSLVTQRTQELNNKLHENKKLYKRLIEAEQYKNNYFVNLSHELRTPLTTIGLQIESLIDKVWEPTEERLISIQSEILRLTRLVKSLEELSHYDSESLILEKEEVDIQELIKSLVINFEKQALDKNIQITTTLKSIVA
ncbi:histidine kinase, partial [Clostridium saudiense]|nr:histidine kinase [Clostridium saudiense]